MSEKRYFIAAEYVTDLLRKKVHENFSNVREDSSGIYYTDRSVTRNIIEDLNESLSEMNE